MARLRKGSVPPALIGLLIVSAIVVWAALQVGLLSAFSTDRAGININEGRVTGDSSYIFPSDHGIWGDQLNTRYGFVDWSGPDHYDNLGAGIHDVWRDQGYIVTKNDFESVNGIEDPAMFEASCVLTGWKGTTTTDATGTVTVKAQGVGDAQFKRHLCSLNSITVTCTSGDCGFSQKQYSELTRLERDVLGNIKSNFAVEYSVSMKGGSDDGFDSSPSEPSIDPVTDPSPTIIDRVVEWFENLFASFR